MTLFLVSFLAGILTVLAPCVLPVLPVILAGSLTEKQKWYPYIVTLSLAISVVLFTVLLKVSTILIDIPSFFWKYLSWGILLGLGFIYIFPHSWTWVGEKLKFSRSNHSLDKAQNIGNPLVRAIVTGAVLGPVFSTCSPTYSLLLATVFPVSILAGIGYTLVYALGLSCMLTLIALGGRSIVSRFRPIADESGWLKKTLWVVFFLVGLSIITGLDKIVESKVIEKFDVSHIEQSLLEKTGIENPNTSSIPPHAEGEEVSETTKISHTAPEIHLKEWINSPPLTMQELRWKVVIIDFWTYSCINCQRTLPHLVEWDKKYRDLGLVIIGVHAPEFSFEKKRRNVEQAIQDAHIEYPVVLDNDFALWSAYNNQYWPAKYFIDKNGLIRYTHFGEGAYAESEKRIQELLSEGKENTIHPPVAPEISQKIDVHQSPETYLWLSRRENYQQSASALDLHTWTLSGTWTEFNDSIKAEEDAKLDFHFRAKDVYLVLAGKGKVSVKVNGKSAFPWTDVQNGILTLSGERMYHLVHADRVMDATVELEFPPWTEAYAFTFWSS